MLIIHWKCSANSLGLSPVSSYNLTHFYWSMCYPETCLPHLWTSHVASAFSSRHLRLCPSSSQQSPAPEILPSNWQVSLLLINESETYSHCTKLFRGTHRLAQRTNLVEEILQLRFPLPRGLWFISNWQKLKAQFTPALLGTQMHYFSTTTFPFCLYPKTCWC